jgi:hypothetical protein
LGGAGELGLAFGVEGDDLSELALKVREAVTQPLILPEEMLEALAFVGALDGPENLGGVAVEGLSGGGTKAGTSGDGAVAVLEDGSGVGDAKGGR